MAFKPTVANRNLSSWFGSTCGLFVSPHQWPQLFSSGGNGALNKVSYEEGSSPSPLPPPPPMSSPNIFIHTFGIPFYWQMVTLSHTTAVNLPSFKYELVTKPWSFLACFHSYKLRLLALLGPLSERNGSFPDPFIHFNQWNPCPLIYLKAEKGTPFERSLPV